MILIMMRSYMKSKLKKRKRKKKDYMFGVSTLRRYLIKLKIKQLKTIVLKLKSVEFLDDFDNVEFIYQTTKFNIYIV